jgi:hypothetical protein
VFKSADFRMSPSDIEVKLNILLANLKFSKDAHQLPSVVKLHTRDLGFLVLIHSDHDAAQLESWHSIQVQVTSTS